MVDKHSRSFSKPRRSKDGLDWGGLRQITNDVSLLVIRFSTMLL